MGKADKKNKTLEGAGFAISLLLIIIMALLIYSNTFSSPFLFDDIRNIVENNMLRDLTNFWPPTGSRYIGELYQRETLPSST